MPGRKHPILPNSKPPKAVSPFPEGSRVHLVSCRFGEPGIVEKALLRRVTVRWPQFNFTGRYKVERLVLADTEGEMNHEQQTQQAT
jgi:hypothetical protein